jgi:hypothetical protein
MQTTYMTAETVGCRRTFDGCHQMMLYSNEILDMYVDTNATTTTPVARYSFTTQLLLPL